MQSSRHGGATTATAPASLLCFCFLACRLADATTLNRCACACASASGTGSFVLHDGLSFMSYAAQAIAQDEFSKCFTQKPRNSFRTLLFSGPVYLADGFVRYFILFPARQACRIVHRAARTLFQLYCTAYLYSWGGRIKYHGTKPRIDKPHVFVTNHTSVIDYVVLSSHCFPHATVAQTHGGLIGFLEHSVLTLNGSLMFNRSEKNDRSILARKMRQHVHNCDKVPLLIFPEGTCVNNEYTVLFHKGAFELDAIVAPVAIKYDKSWADAYWHSKAQSFTAHLLYLMTRWALVADVWYLEPRAKREGQSAADFANEVKAEISAVAKLKNLSWDGYFKNTAPAVEKRAQLKMTTQTRYGAILRKRRNQAQPSGHIRRSSYSIPDRLNTQDFVSNQFPSHLESPAEDFSTVSTNSKNRVLVALNDADRSQDMIEAIADRRNNVVDTWKRYTKLRSDDDELRRVENSSWRLWFKQRIDQAKKAEQEELARQRLREQQASEQVRLERKNSAGSSVLGIMSSYLTTFSTSASSANLYADNAGSNESSMMRRTRSFGSAMSSLALTSLSGFGRIKERVVPDVDSRPKSAENERSRSVPRHKPQPARFEIADDDSDEDEDEDDEEDNDQGSEDVGNARAHKSTVRTPL
eukprot:jgi/Hompol1/6528/HPOL_003646-RA